MKSKYVEMLDKLSAELGLTRKTIDHILKAFSASLKMVASEEGHIKDELFIFKPKKNLEYLKAERKIKHYEKIKKTIRRNRNQLENKILILHRDWNPSIFKIAKKLGVTASVVKTVLKRHGEPINSSNNSHREATHDPEGQVGET